MRFLILLLSLSASAWLAPGCRTAQGTQADAGTYRCPSCKEVVAWSYHPRGLPAGAKTFTHTCPECKREWTSAGSAQSTCAECGKQHMSCPVCRRHGQ